MPKKNIGSNIIGRQERVFRNQTENIVQKAIILQWNYIFKLICLINMT